MKNKDVVINENILQIESFQLQILFLFKARWVWKQYSIILLIMVKFSTNFTHRWKFSSFNSENNGLDSWRKQNIVLSINEKLTLSETINQLRKWSCLSRKIICSAKTTPSHCLHTRSWPRPDKGSCGEPVSLNRSQIGGDYNMPRPSESSPSASVSTSSYTAGSIAAWAPRIWL